MSTPIKLISTDFDGTVHSDWEQPPIPRELEQIIHELQGRGARWIINTGRDLTSLLETLNRAAISVRPDFVVVVEREIYELQESDYISVKDWNDRCTEVHRELFQKVRPHLAPAHDWIKARYKATVYEDPWSPFCLIAEKTSDAEAIHEFLELHYSQMDELTVVRNDIYARFSHKAYNKGTALAEIARRLKVKPEEIVAAGDHLNDLPMLRSDYAKWLVAPVNAIDLVKESVRKQNGLVTERKWGHGVAQGIREVFRLLGATLETAAVPRS